MVWPHEHPKSYNLRQHRLKHGADQVYAENYRWLHSARHLETTEIGQEGLQSVARSLSKEVRSKHVWRYRARTLKLTCSGGAHLRPDPPIYVGGVGAPPPPEHFNFKVRVRYGKHTLFFNGGISGSSNEGGFRSWHFQSNICQLSFLYTEIVSCFPQLVFEVCTDLLSTVPMLALLIFSDLLQYCWVAQEIWLGLLSYFGWCFRQEWLAVLFRVCRSTFLLDFLEFHVRFSTRIGCTILKNDYSRVVAWLVHPRTAVEVQT